MTLKKEKEEELFLDFSHDYQQAVFGSFHIAFMTRDENYVLPKEDFDSLKEYLERFIFRPLKNLLIGTREFDGEFNVEEDSSGDKDG